MNTKQAVLQHMEQRYGYQSIDPMQQRPSNFQKIHFTTLETLTHKRLQTLHETIQNQLGDQHDKPVYLHAAQGQTLHIAAYTPKQ